MSTDSTAAASDVAAAAAHQVSGMDVDLPIDAATAARRRRHGQSCSTDRPQPPPRALNTSAGGGQPRRPQWRPAARPRREKAPEPAAQVLWVKKDGLCSTCNRPANTPGHVQPCTLPRVCWTCDKPGHEASECPQPRSQDKRPKKTKPAGSIM